MGVLVSFGKPADMYRTQKKKTSIVRKVANSKIEGAMPF